MRDAGNRIPEQLDPFPGEALADRHRDTGDVAARPAEARHDACLDRIGHAAKHDGDSCGCSLGSVCSGIPANHEHIDLQAQHLSDEIGKPLHPPCRVSRLFIQSTSDLSATGKAP